MSRPPEEMPAHTLPGCAAVATESNLEKLMRIAMDTGKMNYRCMSLLDTANAELYGIPDAVELKKTIEKGPFIIVSGNNLHDLEDLLKQTSGKGISVYTHGDMLPRESYSDRVFTTGAVYWPSAPHIDDRKDFSPVIEKAIQQDGYSIVLLLLVLVLITSVLSLTRERKA